MRCPKCQRDNQDDSSFCAGCGAEFGGSSPAAALDEAQTLTRSTTTSKWTAGQTLAGKYTIVGELGKGGMGEVYLAEDTSLDRKVALKFLPEATYRDPTMRARFVREAKAAAALSHPYICGIHEVGEIEDKLYFAMEFVEGKTLREIVRQGPLAPAKAVEVAAEIAEALRAAHEKGLIHRDIKPANIMLTPGGHAKVMDFGLAKHFAKPGSDTTVGGALMTVTGEGLTPGTPAYMSPEQLRGRPLDPRSDIFSFGIVLYEMLSGRHPFGKEGGLTTVSAILSEEPQPIAGVIPGAPEGLQNILSRMLAKDPGDRYASMAEVHEDLKRVNAELQAKAKPWFKPVRTALSAVILAGSVLGAAWLAKVIFFKTPAQALAFQARDWILVTDFENLTGDEVFDAGLETALAVSIQQSQYVNVFPLSRVRETLNRMKRAGVTRLDEAVGREIALREGLKALLVCGISRVGADFLLTAKLVDPDKETTVFSESARAKTDEDILAGIDTLAKKVRHGLGESLARIDMRRLPLVKATTTSFEALKNYSKSRLVPADVGFQLLKQALELDPDFALAHIEQGIKFYISGNRVDGEAHFQKALSLMDRLTSREQLWVRAVVEDWRGNRDEGIRNYKAYLAQYPDDSSAWFRLGYAQMISGQREEAIVSFKRMAELDEESADALVNIATCYGSLMKKDEALAHYQKAFALNPNLETGLFINNEYGFLLVRMGKVQEAEESFRKMTALADKSKKTKGLRSLGLLRMYQGRYAEAEESLKESAGLNKALNAYLSEYRDHLYLAIAYGRKGQDAAFEKELAALEQIRSVHKIEPGFLAELGKLYARSGKLAEAARVLDNVRAAVGELLAASGVGRSAQSDHAAFQQLKGEIEIARKQYQEAFASLELAANIKASQLEDSLALAFRKSGNIDKAIEEYLKFIDEDVLGREAMDYWCLAPYELGVLNEKKGDAAEAAKWFGRFLELWKDADPDIAEVVDAKRRLAALTPR
jgi:tetratricopeptide (TPR) repeat protein/tRNA A-37 threonylcarbamoyl transferase component Bud32